MKTIILQEETTVNLYGNVFTLTGEFNVIGDVAGQPWMAVQCPQDKQVFIIIKK
jgi:hypothetical protein